MTNQQILTKAIEKAIAGGWKDLRWRRVLRDNNFIDVPINEIIFSHDFAKALWGEENFYSPEIVIPKWQYHLQQLVIAEDVFKYLGGNI